mgnify:CR=1 FL=1
MKELNNNQLERLHSLFTTEEISALAMGFPISDDFGLNFVDDEFESNFVDDNEFNDFLTKKMRDRGRKRRALRKSGSSRKEARKQARVDIPRDKIKDALKKLSLNNIKKDLGKLGRVGKMGAFLVPRQAYIGLIALNYRGNALRLESIIYGNNQNLKNQLKDKWENGLGGNYAKLVGAVNKGRNKKPFFCGAKCKSKASEYSNVLAEGTIAVLIGAGSSVIGYLASIVNQGKISKTKEKEIDALKQISDKEIDSMSDAERLRAETERKLIESQTDPRNLIINNPNLSPQEKKDALALYDKTFGAERKAKLIKYSVIGAIALGGIFLLTRVLRNK